MTTNLTGINNSIKSNKPNRINVVIGSHKEFGITEVKTNGSKYGAAYQCS